MTFNINIYYSASPQPKVSFKMFSKILHTYIFLLNILKPIFFWGGVGEVHEEVQ